MSVKRYCGSAAAGTETARMNALVEWYADGGDDQGTPYVLASDYDAILTELTDLRMKLGFRDVRIEALEAALRGVLPKFWASDDADEAVYQNAKTLLAQSETKGEQT